MNGGFQLNPFEWVTFQTPALWPGGRLWARTGCQFDPAGTNGMCETGDCGGGLLECGGSGPEPPISLAEITLGGGSSEDLFAVSYVDGFNLPITIDVSGSVYEVCIGIDCQNNLNPTCPEELRVTSKVDAVVVGCKSACVAFKEDRYCCTGEYNTPDLCKPTNYSMIFKDSCFRAHTYAFDDSTTFTCYGASYWITFC